MNRRKFISDLAGSGDPDFVESSAALGMGGLSTGEEAPERQDMRRLIRSTKGLEPIGVAEWNANTAAHLLRRTMFGPTRAEIQQAAAQTLDASLASLFAAQPLPAPPVGPTPPLATGQTWVNSAFDSTYDNTFAAYLKAWWLGLMTRQGISILEKMVLFWHNHFATEYVDVQDSRFMYRQLDLFRQNALGNFKVLVKLVTLDPAMLRYLNGNTNVVGRPNENYARELQELFTIGKGPEIAQGNYTNYTEQDVQAAAKVLTGYADTGYRNTTTATIGYSFTSGKHDASNKQFSSAYGNAVIQGRTGTDGAKELDDLLTMIFAQKDADGISRVAKYICRKLYRWFVYYAIDNTVEQNVIAPLATIMQSNNYEIQPVLDALFRSAHFYDENTVGCLIKNPVDFVAGSIRQAGIATPDLASVAFYRPFNDLRSRASNMQMNLLDPPNVAGWQAYYQAPDFHELWINTTTLPLSGQFTDLLFSGVGGLTFDRIAFVRTMSDPSDPFKLVDDLAAALYPLALTKTQKEYLLYSAMGLKVSDEYEWTLLWNAYSTNPTTTNRNNLLKLLDPLLKFMFRMPEYHLS
jgi:uncharacterized protein (DUF1800 family)